MITRGSLCSPAERAQTARALVPSDISDYHQRLMGTPVVNQVRVFNRTYTQHIGLLDESFLGSGRSLGLSRLLFEIGKDGADVLDLRTRLGLDSGYVSRMLRQLADEGLVTVEQHDTDGRRRTVTLTRAGMAEWERLDRESQQAASDLVTPLTQTQREELASALRTANRLLAVATIHFDAVDPRHPQARAAVESYFAELGRRFPSGFDASALADADAAQLSPPDGVFLVARSGTSCIGCGGVQRHDDRTGEIKRMWIDPGWRGLGFARRLLAELEQQASSLGYSSVVLDTNGVLLEAIALYESSGYEPTARYNDNPYAQRWFRKALR